MIAEPATGSLGADMVPQAAAPVTATSTDAPRDAAEVFRRRFPPRADQDCWARSLLDADAVEALLSGAELRAATAARQWQRVRGTQLLLEWLATFPGRSWQQRWNASGIEERNGSGWEQVPRAWLRQRHTGGADRTELLGTGLMMLICADVLRPSMAWMHTRHLSQMTRAMAAHRDPVGMDALRQALTVRKARPDLATRCLLKVSIIMARKGGTIADITPGDCVEAADAQGSSQRQSQGWSLLYEVLQTRGQFPPGAPTRIWAFRFARGQRTVDHLVDRYGLECQPVRDLLIAYLKQRQPRLDYTSLDALARALAGPFFWRDLEVHHPGIASLRLPPDVAEAWKQRARTKTARVRQPDGCLVTVRQPRTNHKTMFMAVRALYLDIAQWAAEDSVQWGPWVAPCPVADADVDQRKDKRQRKSRTDQRTRDRLPSLPLLACYVAAERDAAAARLHALHRTAPGEVFTAVGETLRRVRLQVRDDSVWAQSVTPGANRRNVAFEEHQAFWAWAIVEVLRHTGIRIEELTELSHHSITQYRLPTTGELVPLLHIAPSKTDEERLLLVSPELADVLSAIVSRVRRADGRIPDVAAYDSTEKVWNPPMPLLLQRPFGGEHRPISPGACRQILNRAIAGSGLAGPTGQPLTYRPHDFRRMFVTDAIMNGLPPHIAQIICGTAASTPPWATRRSTLRGQSRRTTPSSPGAARPGPARSTAPQPKRNGTSSSPTSRSASSQSAPALAPSARRAFMNMRA